MTAFKRATTIVGVLILIVIVLVVVVLAGLSSKPNEDSQTPPTRESAIPSAAVKVSVAEDLHPPILYSDDWNNPVPLLSAVNTAGAEDSPFMMPDGNTLYFFFTPDPNIPPEKQLLDGVTGIYVSKKQDGFWLDAERIVLQDSGKLALDGAEFVQGNVMWFASAREGFTGLNLFTTEFRDGKWVNWQYTGDKINKEYQVGEMHITADGSEMYFHSSRTGGEGQYDIWVTEKVGDEWQEPQNIAVVNSAENEGWPFISQDGSELWFTRIYMGTPAIYRSIKVNDGWSDPQLILSQFAGEPSLDNAGNIYFTHHFYNSTSQMLEADIYVALKK
jgi:hypothetical protein